MAAHDPRLIDISQYVLDADAPTEPDDSTIPGLTNKTITITGTWRPWMPQCGICGERFAIADDGLIAKLTCEALGYSVLACYVCAESFMDETH